MVNTQPTEQVYGLIRHLLNMCTYV